MRLTEEKAVDLRSETKPTGVAGQATKNCETRNNGESLNAKRGPETVEFTSRAQVRAAGSGQKKKHQQTNAGRLPVRSSNSGQLTCPSLAINQGKKASNQTTTEAQNASLEQRGAIRSKGQLHYGLRCFFFPVSK